MPTDKTSAPAWTIDEAVAASREALIAVADPGKAADMAAYMKHQAPFFGVNKPLTTPVLRELIARCRPEDDTDYDRLVRALWAEPEREMQYLALGAARRWKRFHTMEHLPLFRDLIVTGAWWDVVDDIAANLVGPVVRAEPEDAWAVIDTWIDDPDMWLRRTAIICQLKSKEETDEQRLFAFCAARAHEKEFFIRKAIGWALRQHARVNRAAVVDFLRDYRDELSGLSFREAAKHLGPV